MAVLLFGTPEELKELVYDPAFMAAIGQAERPRVGREAFKRAVQEYAVRMHNMYAESHGVDAKAIVRSLLLELTNGLAGVTADVPEYLFNKILDKIAKNYVPMGCRLKLGGKD